jgi:hypothetical protein
MPTWGLMVLSFPGGWGGVQAFDANSLRLLSTLGPRLGTLVPKLEDGSADRFAAVLDQVLETLKNDNTIHGDVGRYLLNLILHMKMVIEEYRLDIRGDYDLARAATILKTTIDTAYNSSTNEDVKPRSHSDGSAIEWSTIWPMLMLGGGK